MRLVHDFGECLERSRAAHDLPLWEEMYRKAFSNMVGMHRHESDGWHQRAGIDRSVVLDTSKVILIDEKIRGRNKKTGKVYGDIALEWMSNDKRKTPGWVNKPLQCDYIAYAIAPLGKGYLLPVLQLQQAWAKHGEDWKGKYKRVVAPNNGYDTISCAVPVKELFGKMGGELRAEFTPCEWYG